MTLEEFKKKYGTVTAVLMIDHLLSQLSLNPDAQKQYNELKRDLKSLFNS